MPERACGFESHLGHQRKYIMYKVADEEYNTLRAWTREYIDKYCIVRDTKMPGKAKGSTYIWMFYLRRGLFNPRFLTAISLMFLYRAEREISVNFDFQISGLETAATPMLASIPLVAMVRGISINSFVVRKDRKEYGLLNQLEGIPNDKPVVMLDDLCNSSWSLATCGHLLQQEQLTLAATAFTIVNKSNKGVHSEERLHSDMYLPKEIKVISLFDLDDFNLDNPSH